MILLGFEIWLAGAIVILGTILLNLDQVPESQIEPVGLLLVACLWPIILTLIVVGIFASLWNGIKQFFRRGWV